MADDLDRFVLQYSVDLKDSIARLERLNQQVEKTNKGGKDLGATLTNEVKGALDGLSNSFGGLESRMGGVLARFGALGSAAGVAAAGIGAAIALAAKGIRDMNAMQDLSYKTGIAPLQMENIQRNLAHFSNGRVSRSMTQQGLEQFRAFWQDAFVNPTGKSALAMSRMGINPHALGPNASLSAAAAWMNAHPDAASALAIGHQIGWNPNLTNAMAAGGSNITAMSLSPEAVANHQKAQEAAQRVNKFLGDLEETLSEWSFETADKVINFFRTIGHLLGSVSTAAGQAEIDQADAITGGTKPRAKTSEQQDAIAAKAAAENKAAAEKQVHLADEEAKAQAESDARWQQILATFDASVDKFSQTINIQQAWAGWAGMIGRAAGLPGSSVLKDLSGNNATFSASTQTAALTGSNGSRGLRNNNPGNIEYGDFAKAHGATGSDGRFAVFPDTQTGYAAMGALLAGSGYAGGGRNSIEAIVSKYAPPKENDTAGYIAFVAKQTGLDPNKPLTAADLANVQAAMAQHESGYVLGGSPYNPRLNDAYDRSAVGSFTFSGQPFKRGNGESRETMQYTGVAGQLAADLRVPVDQVLRGGVTKADIDWSGSNLMATALNTRQALKMQLGNTALPDIQRAQIVNHLRDTDMEIQNLMKYVPTLEGKAREGGRSISIGAPRIIVNNTAVSDPKRLAEEIREELSRMMNSLLINNATSWKG